MKLLFILAFLAVGFLIYLNIGSIELFVYKHRHDGLINDDHGILSKDDLIKAGHGRPPPTPFDGINDAYPYWQCFHKKHLRIDCSYLEPIEKPGSSLEISIETDSEVHLYGLSHAISGEICSELTDRMNKILLDTSYFCINGSSGSLDSVLGLKREYSWTFHDFKTQLGYANLSQE